MGIANTRVLLGTFAWVVLVAGAHAGTAVKKADKMQSVESPEACRTVDAHTWLTGSGDRTRSVLIATHDVCGAPQYVSLTPPDIAYLKDKLEATESTIHYLQMNPSYADCMHRLIDVTSLPADARAEWEDHLLIYLLVDAKSAGLTVVGPLDNCPLNESGPGRPAASP